LLAIQGAIASYFSTVWTLAYREWTGLVRVAEPPLEPTVV
jgi:hypothetical protein